MLRCVQWEYGQSVSINSWGRYVRWSEQGLFVQGNEKGIVEDLIKGDVLSL
jgi:hypothetical protein